MIEKIMAFPGVSIIICCYNSASRLPATLKHIALQRVADTINFEVIIVDNNSNDNTASIAATEWEQYNLKNISLRIVNEYNAGLSHARAKGVSVSLYEFILFCDDDNWLCNDYVEKIYNLLHEKPAIGAVGGQGISVSDAQLPEWFDEVKESYVIGKQAENSCIVNSREYLWGAGLASRKKLYEDAYPEGFKSFLSDRKGKELSSGGDSEYCKRVLLMGYDLYYDEYLTFKHFIPVERLSIQYKDRLHQGFLQAKPILDMYSLFIYLNTLPTITKNKTVAASCIKYLIRKVIPIKKWTLSYDSIVIHFFTGFNFKELPEDVKLMRKMVMLYKKHHSSLA